MALEKECDLVLRRLFTISGGWHTLAAMNNYLIGCSCVLNSEQLMTVMVILSHNEHIQLSDSRNFHILKGEDGEALKCSGDITITPKGLAFIANNSYEQERDKNDLLLDLTISNGKIQSRLLHINRWIAFGGLAVAVSSILEIVRNYYSPLLPFLIGYALPFLTALFVIWLSYKFLQVTLQKRSKNK